MRLVLASSSPRRQRLLRDLGLPFAVVKPQVDESRNMDEALLDYVERLSREKAETAAHTLGDAPALVIAADTIVIDCEGGLLGKPVDAADARRMLRRLRNREHTVVTAFTILQTGERSRTLARQVRTAVTMRDYSDEEIEAYIASGDPFDKAGGYAIQNKSFNPVARIKGSYSNVVGLPLAELQEVLEEFSAFSAPCV